MDSTVADVELILAMLAAMVALATIARRLGIPYPILFVLGGFALGLLPGVPRITLPPELILLIFLPPLLYSAGVFLSPRQIHENLQPIALLAVGLVLATTLAVGLVAHVAVVGLSWAGAFVLGALVSSTDSTTALAIAQRLGLPSRIVAILEGESLFNDATSLVLYQVAVAAVVTGRFSPAAAALSFVVAGLGGVAIGLAVGWLAARIRPHLADPRVEITLTLLTPFVAWIPAGLLGVSSVLAVATAGMYIGQERLPEEPSETRLRAQAFWDVLTFLLEGLLFILTGLQLNQAFGGIRGLSLGTIVGEIAVVCVVVIGIRIVWVFVDAYFPRPGQRQAAERRTWRNVAVVAWAGMRGGETLAPALALPLLTAGGAPFPARGLIISLTLGVIFVTLVLEGLTLPTLVRRLGVDHHGDLAREERLGRAQLDRAALAELDRIAAEGNVSPRALEEARRRIEHDLRDRTGERSPRHHELDVARRRLRRAIIAAEREEIARLRGQGDLDDESIRELERQLDLEEVTFEAGAPPRDRAG